MRQVTESTALAFKEGRPVSISNSKVMGDKNNCIYTLFDNVIATLEGDKLLLTDSGYKTATTKERLNGILSVFNSEWRVYQLKGQWFITDGMGVKKEWSGVLQLTV